MEWLEIGADLAVLAGVVIAIYNINAWRREHVGKKRLELAEDTLALFYEAADAIRHIRSPAGFGYEFEDLERREGETDAQFEARKKASVVFYRYQQYQEIFSKLRASRYRFMAQIGKDAAQPFDELHAATTKIISSAQVLARMWAREHFRDDKQRQHHWDRLGEYEAIFWEGLGTDDPINPKLDTAIRAIETTCRAIITGKQDGA